MARSVTHGVVEPTIIGDMFLLRGLRYGYVLGSCWAVLGLAWAAFGALFSVASGGFWELVRRLLRPCWSFLRRFFFACFLKGIEGRSSPTKSRRN